MILYHPLNMKLTAEELWLRFQKSYTEFPSIELAVDFSRMNYEDSFLTTMQPALKRAFDVMAALEGGAIANPDEKRMVGHYWLRNTALAPTEEIRTAIEAMIESVKAFSRDVHEGRIRGVQGLFKNLLVIGIGGSALGPQFASHALGHPSTDKLKPHFLDNTDPDGMDKVLASITGELGRTLCIVISKSGGTKETRNGMLEAKAAYERSGIVFGKHAVAVTGEGSELDLFAKREGWLRRFPMWDWVGGRTSQTSAVGLLPAALQGLDIDRLIEGARACDEVTRTPDFSKNPAAQLALMWYHAGKGKGTKDMVVLPYKDRLELFSKYLQQLIMESLGKERDINNIVVNQGLSVYGNKGSTDQHAYVQQLREGLNNFFVTFIEVLRDRSGSSISVEPGVTSGDYLNGFFLGTRQALYDNDRESITVTLNEVSPFTVGVLIALYERTVGLYASLINVNAYHQPGVEAGKKAAAGVINLQLKLIEYFAKNAGRPFTAEEMTKLIDVPGSQETVFKICEHLAMNPDHGLRRVAGSTAASAAYTYQRT